MVTPEPPLPRGRDGAYDCVGAGRRSTWRTDPHGSTRKRGIAPGLCQRHPTQSGRNFDKKIGRVGSRILRSKTIIGFRPLIPHVRRRLAAPPPPVHSGTRPGAWRVVALLWFVACFNFMARLMITTMHGSLVGSISHERSPIRAAQFDVCLDLRPAESVGRIPLRSVQPKPCHHDQPLRLVRRNCSDRLRSNGGAIARHARPHGRFRGQLHAGRPLPYFRIPPGSDPGLRHQLSHERRRPGLRSGRPGRMAGRGQELALCLQRDRKRRSRLCRRSGRQPAGRSAGNRPRAAVGAHRPDRRARPRDLSPGDPQPPLASRPTDSSCSLSSSSEPSP